MEMLLPSKTPVSMRTVPPVPAEDEDEDEYENDDGENCFGSR